MRFAARDLGLEIEELLVGPTAVAFIEGDPVNVAKALRTPSSIRSAPARTQASPMRERLRERRESPPSGRHQRRALPRPANASAIRCPPASPRSCAGVAEHLGQILVATARQADEVELAVSCASTQASACAVSSAGMMPSSRASSRNACSACSSVTAT